MEIFQNREEAGRKLGESLEKHKFENPIIIAIPRGGVVVGYEVAKILKASLDVVIARKIGVPYQPELGMGAVAEGDVEILDKDLIRKLQIPKNLVNEVIVREKKEIERRKSLYREDRPILNIENRIVILVDDGLATGVSAKAAIKQLRKLKPKKIIFASPVCAKDTAENMKHLVDGLFCLFTSAVFNSVGAWYQSFDQVTDEEVKELLNKKIS
ncbi:MAG: phosphoribosyltransferase [Patescibacteria group bacterium]